MASHNEMRVLVVCAGNTCRSPIAEAVLRQEALRPGAIQITVASAGVRCRTPGGPADPRAVVAAGAQGLDIARHHQRQFADTDFANHDLILAMDGSVMEDLLSMAPEHTKSHVRLFLGDRDVPDPYMGSAHDYDATLQMIIEGARRLLSDPALPLN